MRKLILSRPAESTANSQGIVCAEPTCLVNLTDEGRHQAKRLAQQLLREDISLCVTSELSRSVDTADVALAGRAIPRLVVADFNDPLAGSFEHSPAAEFNQWLAKNGTSVPTPDGESQQDALNRYLKGYEILMSRQEEGIVAVIHRLPILWLLRAAQDDPPHEIGYAVAISLHGAEVDKALAKLRSRPTETMSY